MSRDELFLFHVLGSWKPQYAVAEEKRIVAVVKAESELIKVTVEILRGSLMVRANQ